MGPMMLKAILLDDLRKCPKSNMVLHNQLSFESRRVMKDAMHELFTVFDGIQSLDAKEAQCIKQLLSVMKF